MLLSIRKMSSGFRAKTGCAIVTLLVGGLVATPVQAQDAEPQYTIVDGKVDKATYNGYRRFHGICHTCHGQDAMGSTIAPALVESLNDLTYEEYVQTVENGRTVTNTDGSVSAMPPFKENVDIMKYKDDIYMYLKARSDGELGPGRPEKIPS